MTDVDAGCPVSRLGSQRSEVQGASSCGRVHDARGAEVNALSRGYGTARRARIDLLATSPRPRRKPRGVCPPQTWLIYPLSRSRYSLPRVVI